MFLVPNVIVRCRSVCHNVADPSIFNFKALGTRFHPAPLVVDYRFPVMTTVDVEVGFVVASLTTAIIKVLLQFIFFRNYL